MTSFIQNPGSEIADACAKVEYYERPERDQFTELPGSDKPTGGELWRDATKVPDPDADDGTNFPLEFQVNHGISYETKKCVVGPPGNKRDVPVRIRYLNL